MGGVSGGKFSQKVQIKKKDNGRGKKRVYSHREGGVFVGGLPFFR